jgi:predicted transcriptional regulator
MATQKVVVGNKQKKSHLTLPKETAEILKNLAFKERKAYAEALCNKGWTYQSIADVLGLSRQAIEQYVKSNSVKSGEVRAQIIDLPIPELPTTPIYKSQIVEADPQVIAELKELHSKAKLVRGKGKAYRKEAELFTKLAWEQCQNGITIYSLAKSLGITNGALTFRFVRYGYMKSNGKAKVFRQLTNRESLDERSN